MKSVLRPSLVFLLRQWKSGELQLLAFALFISVVSITSLVFLTSHVRSMVEDKTGELLGSDRVISSPAPLNPSFEKKAKELGLQVTSTLNFLTMVVHQNALTLTDMRAVGEQYPLRGMIRSASQLYGADEAVRGIPAHGTVWLEARVLTLLDAKIGDKISIGSAVFIIARVLTAEPDRTFEGFNMAPWGLMNVEDVPDTHIIQPGSRVNYKLLMAGKEEQLTFFEAWVKPKLLANETWVDARHSRPMITLAVDRVDHYLGLVFLINICFAGIAIFRVTRRFTERQFDTVALLRCFGASRSMILIRYAVSFMVLGLAVGVLGIGVGFLLERAFVGMFFHEYFPTQSFPILSNFGLPVLMGLLTVFVLLFGFSLPSLLSLWQIMPLRVLRRDLPHPKYALVLGSIFSVMSITIFIIFQTGEFQLTRIMLLITLSVSLLLWGVAFGVLKYIGRIKLNHSFSSMLLLIWIRNMGRRAKDNAFQIIAFSLVFGFMGALFLIRTNLVKEWEAQIPVDAPNYFVLNIPSTELSSFQEALKNRKVKASALYPMLLARVLAVNQDPVAMVEEPEVKNGTKKRVFPRLLNITWAENLPMGNKIISGKWLVELTQKNNDPSIVSVEKGFAERLNIQLNDSLTLQIGEKKIMAKVGSIRSVEWSSFRPNFYVIFPPNVLDTFPNTYMTSLLLPIQEREFIKTLVQKFPMINIIGTEMIMTQIKYFLEVMLVTIQYLFLFSVLTCMVLLLSIILATLDERQREAGLLRLLGISKVQLRRILLSEFIGLGFAAGVLGMLIAHGILYWLSQNYFNVPFQVNGEVLLMGPLLGMGLVSMGAWFGTRTIFQTPLWRITV